MTGERRWRAAPTFMVRAPALPVDRFVELSQPDPDRRLVTLSRDPEVALALAVASPSMARAVAAHAAEDGDLAPVRTALASYLVRMSTRPTPFGLFAGIASGSWGDRARVTLGPPARRSRPDMAWLLGLVERYEREPGVRRHLRLTTHPAAHLRGGRAVLPDAAGATASSVRATAVVREALAACRSGVGHAALIHRLTATGRDPDRTRAVVDTLVERGFLVTDLRPALTAEPAREVARVLDAAGASAAAGLRGLLDDLAGWDLLPAGTALRQWPRLLARAEAIHRPDPVDRRVTSRPDAPATPTATFAVDATFTGPAVRLPAAVAREACRAVELLSRLSPWSTRFPGLAAWRPMFAEAYGQDRWVPVLDLVAAGLPEVYAVPPPRPRYERLLVRLAGEAVRAGERVVRLDEGRVAELEEAAGRDGDPPGSVDLFCALAARDDRAVDRGDFLLVVAGVGATAPAGRAFGRFGHLFDGGAPAFLGDLPVGRADGPRIAAELLFEPVRARPANVMVRPVVPEHVIAVNGGPPPAGRRIIPLSELAVVLRGERLALVWTRSGSDVLACGLHLLTPAMAPPLAQFLHAVSVDHESGLLDRFGWGPAEHLPYRPRVQAGRVVLRPAGWSLDRAFLDAYPRDRAGARRAAGLPRYVLLGPRDEQLLIDLDSEVGATLLLAAGRHLPAGARLDVHEALPEPGDAVAWSPDGRRLVELVVPVVRTGTGPTAGGAAPHVAAGHAGGGPDPEGGAAPRRLVPRPARMRPPGSDWLYAKLYLPVDAVDDLLGGPVPELAGRLCRDGAVRSWFFLRYADPRFHVRLRFTGDPRRLRTETLPALCDWAATLTDDGVLDRFALDTYEREVERYGGPAGLDLAEQLFAADSAAVCRLLADPAVRAAPDRRHLAVRTVDDLLAALGHPPSHRLRWYRAHRGARHPVESAEFRADKQRLRASVAPAEARDPVTVALDARRPTVARVAAGLDALAAAGRLETPRPQVVRSLVHMHLNRLLGGAPELERRVFALAGLALGSVLAWPMSGGRQYPIGDGDSIIDRA
ncbi:lantibiotic dehydratase [Micromonospora robiginosa]|uniref:Lantibiotic dehydratase n=1 Tax=Micromonospora robiginosa TaxID=2749844 RepID=A0A7L6B3B1_9ACTN|nr:lantibiotic dehydratase [Micromonospora ferruginea]QLQ36473.1 lantibiotic dehydratase [Micromonospora ferruginea]